MKETKAGLSSFGSGKGVYMKSFSARKIVVTGLLAALSSVLMYLNFALPFSLPFLKIDFSDFPALLASFSVGPLSGVAVCLIKNLVSLPASSTVGFGELSNFILSSAFVLSSGIFYRRHKTKKGALIASAIGVVTMSVCAIFSNYFIVYPAYFKYSGFINEGVLLGIANVDSVMKVVLLFNVPFTFLKGLLNFIITFVLYKRISPILQGKK